MPKFVVTGIVDGYRKEVTKPLSKKRAVASRKQLQKDMKIAIPKYRWVKNLRIKQRR